LEVGFVALFALATVLHRIILLVEPERCSVGNGSSAYRCFFLSTFIQWQFLWLAGACQLARVTNSRALLLISSTVATWQAVTFVSFEQSRDDATDEVAMHMTKVGCSFGVFLLVYARIRAPTIDQAWRDWYWGDAVTLWYRLSRACLSSTVAAQLLVRACLLLSVAERIYNGGCWGTTGYSNAMLTLLGVLWWDSMLMVIESNLSDPCTKTEAAANGAAQPVKCTLPPPSTAVLPKMSSHQYWAAMLVIALAAHAMRIEKFPSKPVVKPEDDWLLMVVSPAAFAAFMLLCGFIWMATWHEVSRIASKAGLALLMGCAITYVWWLLSHSFTMAGMGIHIRHLLTDSRSHLASRGTSFTQWSDDLKRNLMMMLPPVNLCVALVVQGVKKHQGGPKSQNDVAKRALNRTNEIRAYVRTVTRRLIDAQGLKGITSIQQIPKQYWRRFVRQRSTNDWEFLPNKESALQFCRDFFVPTMLDGAALKVDDVDLLSRVLQGPVLHDQDEAWSTAHTFRPGRWMPADFQLEAPPGLSTPGVGKRTAEAILRYFQLDMETLHGIKQWDSLALPHACVDARCDEAQQPAALASETSSGAASAAATPEESRSPCSPPTEDSDAHSSMLSSTLHEMAEFKAKMADLQLIDDPLVQALFTSDDSDMHTVQLPDHRFISSEEPHWSDVATENALWALQLWQSSEATDNCDWDSESSSASPAHYQGPPPLLNFLN
jgi:hypothetical protein